ncbi:TadE/TadG family type IV pilus assembly protein [Aeromicrobium sp. A1-2]|uniref:TadE/TadG family type IV pilus assembly protein n=1 Tax=Aeromicrobium sp. A1-2 TaxID=2107713 RepID=UPI0013C3072E|nr:pilus assembly protein TadG-related protein [Aeromicrobium sp. A1-2]
MSAIFFGLSITVLIAGLGLSVDVGNVAYQRNRAQNAVDNAARDLARSCAQTPSGAECTALQASAVTIAAKSFDGGTVVATTPAAGQIKVRIEKDISTPLLSAIGITSKAVAAEAVASSVSGHPSEGYPVLPLGVGYCTWKNNSAAAGTPSEASNKVALRTDTLQSVRNVLMPATKSLAGVLELGGLFSALGTSDGDSCTDVDGTQLLNFRGAVWLTGEHVATGLLSTVFGWESSLCKLFVSNDLNTFVGGVEGAVFFPAGCASKFGTGKPVDIGKTILLPVYKPQSTAQNKYGFKLSACAGLGSKLGSISCAEVPPKVGARVVGYAPFKVTGWTFPGTPSATDSSVGCPAMSPLSLKPYDIANATFTFLEKILGVVTSLLSSLLGLGTLTASVACNGLQGYFTKSFSKDPNFQYSSGAPDFGANYVKLTK